MRYICDIVEVHNEKVGCNTIKYMTGFLYSNWLYFLCHGIKESIPPKGVFQLKKSIVFVSINTAPILSGDQLHCCECQKEFLTSYVYKHFEVPVCDNCRSVQICDNLLEKDSK